MWMVYTCDGDPPMCDNKGAEKNKGGRSKEGGERKKKGLEEGGDTDSHDRNRSEYDTSGVC